MTVACLFSLHHIGISPSLDGSVSNFLTKHAPRLFCYLETPRLLWANVVMDALIALSYAAIFVCLMWIAYRLRGLSKFARYLWVFVSFGLFIAACGGTHLMDVVDLWYPSLTVATDIRILCAAASVPTAVLFARATPSIERSIRSFIEAMYATTRQRDFAQDALAAATALTMERRLHVEEVATANRQLNAVMNSTSELIIQIGPDWTILYGNREAAAALPDFCVGANFWTCFPGLRGSDAEQRLLIAMNTRKEDEFSNYYELYDRWYQNRLYPTQEGVSLFSLDITAGKRLQESLWRERVKREQHVEQLSHMAAGLAHEISNPLAIIHARASDLEELADRETSVSSAAVQQGCRNIVLTAERAIRILRGLKGLSREASNDPMAPADIGDTCTQCVEMHRSRLERYHIAMCLEIPADLPQILCRETQIGQIVSNMLTNSFDAIVESGASEGWISLEVERRGEQVSVKVCDSGPEIPQEIRSRLMEPFFTTKPMGQGTGVGLSLSRAIASDHGGSLMLLEGTTYTSFELLLPIPAADELTRSSLEVLAS